MLQYYSCFYKITVDAEGRHEWEWGDSWEMGLRSEGQRQWWCGEGVDNGNEKEWMVGNCSGGKIDSRD